MNDAFAVRGFEVIGYLDAEFDEFLLGKRLAFHALLQRVTFEQLHDDELLSILLADFENGADVRMIERSGGASFADETFEGALVLRQSLGQELHGDVALEDKILGAIDDAHAAAAELLLDAVMGNDGIEHREAPSGQGICGEW